MDLIQRAIEAHKHLLSAATRHITRHITRYIRKTIHRFSGCDFPAIVTSGDFSNSEGRALKAALNTPSMTAANFPQQFAPSKACRDKSIGHSSIPSSKRLIDRVTSRSVHGLIGRNSQAPKSNFWQTSRRQNRTAPSSI